MFAAVCCMTASAFAQDNMKSYDMVGVSYDNTHLGGKNYEFGDDDAMSLNGFGVEYLHGFSVSKKLPLFLEVGAKVNMGFGSIEEKGYDDKFTTKLQMLRVNVPVSLAYRYSINETMSITPYVGIDFRLNALAQMKGEYTYDGETEETDWISLFDKDKMGEDETWNRFQMGWHIGARFEYTKFSIGLSYGTDFIKAFNYSEDGYKSHVTTGNFALTLGYRF